jgi:hypothetical protein
MIGYQLDQLAHLFHVDRRLGATRLVLLLPVTTAPAAL